MTTVTGLAQTPGWLLVRHARVLTPEGFCYGRLDVPVDPDHTEQSASVIVERWSAPVRVTCSPLQRCRLLAQSLAARWPGLQIDIDERLAEMDFGRWEGRLWREVPREEFDQWRADFADYEVGGGESVRQFMARIAQARRDALSQRRGEDEAVWWITHSGVIRAMQLLERGIDCPDSGRDWPKAALDFGVCHPV